MMKLNSNYKNIKNLHSVIKFFYYTSIVFTGISIFSIFVIPFVPDSAIDFEQGIRQWVYSVDFPLGIGSASIFVKGSIPTIILQFLPIDYINIQATIICDVFVSSILAFMLIVIGLKKMLLLITDILNEESPFQLKYVKSLRKLSYMILLYSTLGNTLLCILLSAFATHSVLITIDFDWIGVLIGMMGYIFSDITEYGLFLQEEYDTTL